MSTVEDTLTYSAEERQARSLLVKIGRKFGAEAIILEKPDACDPAARNVMLIFKFGDHPKTTLELLEEIADTLK